MSVPKRILLYRITHYKNLDFILHNGLHSRNSQNQDPNYVNIGNKDIIGKRSVKPVRLDPTPGMIHEYVPFYFCYRSPMLGSIKVGYSDFKGSQDEIIYLVTDFEHIRKHKCEFVFTDGQALIQFSKFYDDIDDLKNWTGMLSDPANGEGIKAIMI